MSDNAYWDDDYSWDGDSLITWDGEYDTDIITVLPPVIKQPPTPSVPTILSPKSKKIESWDKWATTPQPTQAKASLSIPNLTHVFAFNPDTANWSYQENITSMDTIGGRVTQLLSIQLTGLTITGRAGSRKELQRIATNLKEIMGYHTNTLNPAIFKVPSRKWNFVVYLMDMSNLGWDVTSTSYPYQLQFAVEDDITGIKTKQISSDVINNLQKDIGYDKGHHGGNAQEFYSIIETITKPVAIEDDSQEVLDGDPDGGAGAWGGYTNGKIPYDAMVKIGGRVSSQCCPNDTEPGRYLEPTAAASFKEMDDATNINLVSSVVTAYRSYEYQECLYQAYLDHRCGIELAARPGSSPHGWGKAVDVSTGSPAWTWMKSNASRYGWDWFGTGDDPHFSYVG